MKLVGAGFTDAPELMLYSPAVTCVGLQASSDNELLVRLKLAADCPLGTHAFRVRSKRGISELRAFRVTPFPVVVVEEPNNDLADAKPISPNVTIAGVLESGDVDCYRITLRRGERLAARTRGSAAREPSGAEPLHEGASCRAVMADELRRGGGHLGGTFSLTGCGPVGSASTRE